LLKSIFLIPAAFSGLLFAACTLNTDVFEKNVAIPGQQWESSFHPEIRFRIEDTASLYNIYLVIRHSEAYHFNNIWIQATVRQPGETASRSQRYDLALATNEKGWMGTAMDDIYEQRILLQPQTKFRMAGEYVFSVEQAMREDPLQHVLNIGVRVEKAK
jgi:gliding motility-associated lipoprotein GldH